MLRKYSMSFLAIAILLTSSLFTFAQAPVRGKVELKKADGSLTPVAGASVDVYRTDVKAKLPSAKTDKKGFFVFAGLPFGATMAFVVSGPGIKAEIYPGVKAGREDVNITVYEGDGKALTEDDVRSALSTAPKQGQPGAETEDAKKAREEYEKQVAKYEEEKKKVENTNALVKRVGEEGNKAYNEKNYDLAIARFDEGINADPDFTSNVTLFSNNKALAYRFRGFENYRQGTLDPPNKASWLEKAKSDFQNSLAASQKTFDMIAKITDSIESKKYEQSKYKALENTVEVRRLMIATGAETTQLAEAIAALEAYLAVETDPALKIRNQIQVADAIRLTGTVEQAIPLYRKILEAAPDNVDAMGSLGLCLFSVGVGNANKEMMQEGLNFMQKFSETAPDKPGDRIYMEFKQSVKESVAYLKDVEKLLPQKVKTPAPTTKKKNN